MTHPIDSTESVGWVVLFLLCRDRDFFDAVPGVAAGVPKQSTIDGLRAAMRVNCANPQFVLAGR